MNESESRAAEGPARCWEAAGEAPAAAIPIRTSQDLVPCEEALRHVVLREEASPAAREAVSALNTEASAAMGELVQPARALLESGQALPTPVAACLVRRIAEIAFWRRVLCALYPGQIASPPPADFLVRYLLAR